MQGMTISEMAKILGLERDTVKMRLHVAGIKPITKEAIYDDSAIETIREVSKGGRPPKDTPGKTDKKPKK
jgi:hypothetical protein